MRGNYDNHHPYVQTPNLGVSMSDGISTNHRKYHGKVQIMTLYKNKYRIESARLPGWNYSFPGAYFITICAKNRNCYFGNISDGKMNLSEMGKIANQYWTEIPDHFNNIRLDEFVVMPNHIHGILVIGNANNNRHPNVVQTPNLGVCTVDMDARNDLWKSGTIGVIINQYKRICTIRIHKSNPEFAWQPRFHDRIIRNENELNRIRQYIVDNPKRWEKDNNYVLEVKS